MSKTNSDINYDDRSSDVGNKPESTPPGAGGAGGAETSIASKKGTGTAKKVSVGETGSIDSTQDKNSDQSKKPVSANILGIFLITNKIKSLFLYFYPF